MKTQWKFLKLQDGRIVSHYDGSEWRIGKWRKSATAKLCESGFHASDTVLSALSYARGNVLALVECRGKEDAGADKSAWSQMRILRAWRCDDYVAKRTALYVHYQAKRDRREVEYNESLSILNAEYNYRMTAFADDYKAKLAQISKDDYRAQLSELNASYDAKITPLNAEYASKRAALDADYKARVAKLHAEYNDALVAALCTPENEIVP